MHTGHEPAKQSRGADYTDPAQVMAVCDACHDWIGRNEEAATVLGLLVPNNKSGDAMNTDSLNTALIQMPEDVTTDVLLEAGYQIARLKEIVKEVNTMWEAKMVERIQATGPIKDGDNLYRVGSPPKTSCNNVPAAVEALLLGVGGDFNVFCEHLSSGALKYGAFKATLGEDEFAKHFTVTREPELQTDEATPRRLQKLNLAFSR